MRDKVAQFIKQSVEWLQETQAGCCHYKLDDHLAIYVGWSAGYDERRDDSIIQAEDDPYYAINAGVKVWTSDYMQTDYDYVNFPYYENWDVVDMGITISPNEDYEGLAAELLQWYDEVKDLVLANDGLILEDKNND